MPICAPCISDEPKAEAHRLWQSWKEVCMAPREVRGAAQFLAAKKASFASVVDAELGWFSPQAHVSNQRVGALPWQLPRVDASHPHPAFHPRPPNAESSLPHAFWDTRHPQPRKSGCDNQRAGVNKRCIVRIDRASDKHRPGEVSPEFVRSLECLWLETWPLQESEAVSFPSGESGSNRSSTGSRGLRPGFRSPHRWIGFLIRMRCVPAWICFGEA